MEMPIFNLSFIFTKFHTKIQTSESLNYMLITILQNWVTFNVILFMLLRFYEIYSMAV